MAQEKQHYGKTTYKSIAIASAVIVFVIFTFVYYFLYRENTANFYLPGEQENKRLKIDTSVLIKELMTLDKCLCDVQSEKKIIDLELDALSAIINKLQEKIRITMGNNFKLADNKYNILICKIDDNCKENDTLFEVISDSIKFRHAALLKLKHTDFTKFPHSHHETNKDDKIIDKLKAQEEYTRDRINNLENKEFIYIEEKQNILNELDDERKGYTLNFWDFVILSGNIHTSFGFNGIVPTSSKVRFLCLVHKTIMLIIYFFIYKYWKEKK